MSLTNTATAVVYSGNNSTVTAYPVPFPFLEVGHIYVSTLADGGTAGEDDVLLTYGTDYTVTLFESGLGEVKTTAAVPVLSSVTIFREVPLTQPNVYPVGGPFPAKSHETALDRIMMILQSQARKLASLLGTEDGSVLVIPGSTTESLRDVAVFTNAAARAAAVPVRVGQIGVQADDFSIWLGTATTAGSWRLSVAGVSDIDDEVVIGFASDTGDPGAAQTLVAGYLQGLGATAIVLGGDNSYNGEAEFDDDWAAFDAMVDDEILYPVLGNHDIDGATTYAKHVAKFTYLPGNKRYYNKVLGGGLVEIFVLHSGRNSAWSLIEPDGNTVGSTQHAWFVAALAASTAKYKIVFFHHPPVTTEADSNGYEPNMRWPAFNGVDAVFCGHAHLAEWINWASTPVINVSGAVKTDGDSTLAIVGGGVTAELLYTNDRRPLVAVITANSVRCVVDLVDVVTERVVYSRNLNDLTVELSEWGAEVLSPATTAAVGTYHVGASPVGMLVNEWFVGVASPGATALNGTIKVNGTSVSVFSVAAGNFFALSVPDTVVLPLGALVEVVVTASDSYPAYRGLTVYARGRAVQ